MSEAVVLADRLVKTFGGFRAVEGVSLAIPQGAIYGVLGPNGAGKTTTLRTLPSSGSMMAASACSVRVVRVK